MAWESPLLTTHTHWLVTPAWRPRSHRTELPPEPQQTPLQAPGAGPELGAGRRPRGLPAGGAAHRASKQQRGRQGFEGAWGKGGKEREGPRAGSPGPPQGRGQCGWARSGWQGRPGGCGPGGQFPQQPLGGPGRACEQGPARHWGRHGGSCRGPPGQAAHMPLLPPGRPPLHPAWD